MGPYLDAWEAEIDLCEKPGTIRFRFETAHVIDRDNLPQGSQITLHPRGARVTIAGGQPHVTVSRHSYPQPPDPEAFRITDDVAIALPRWRNYRDGKESFLAMAYFVLTVLENPAITREKAAASPNKPARRRHREKAAQVFAVDYEILDKLGELSSTAGDAATARKFENKQFRDLSESEEAWIEEAVRKLIHRLGERKPGVALKRITIQDLAASLNT